MTFDEVMREFAELIGRVLAQRWLKSRGLALGPEPETNRRRSKPVAEDCRPPSQDSASESATS